MKSLNLRMAWCGLISATVLGTVGCAPSMNPWALRKENAQLKAALRQYQDQVAREKQRAENLDEDNEQLHTMLAQEQEARRQADGGRPQFAQRAARPPSSPPDDEGYDEAGSEIGPAAGRQTGSARHPAKTPSNLNRDSEGDWLPMANVSGAQVLRDGDAVRIRVTNTSLFDPGKATLKPGATKVLDQVASSIRRNYPAQVIGIEGHTDGDPIRKSHWKDNHELSYQRARAVYEYLTARAGVPANQIYIAAYGPNAPIASNKTSGGKAQNRRVEFVVQPDGWRATADGGTRR